MGETGRDRVLPCELPDDHGVRGGFWKALNGVDTPAMYGRRAADDRFRGKQLAPAPPRLLYAWQQGSTPAISDPHARPRRGRRCRCARIPSPLSGRFPRRRAPILPAEARKAVKASTNRRLRQRTGTRQAPRDDTQTGIKRLIGADGRLSGAGRWFFKPLQVRCHLNQIGIGDGGR